MYSRYVTSFTLFDDLVCSHQLAVAAGFTQQDSCREEILLFSPIYLNVDSKAN